MENVGMDMAYRNASAKRDALAAEINQLQQRLEACRRELSRVDTFLRDWSEFAGTHLDAQFVEAVDTVEKSVQVRRTRPRNPRKEDVVAKAVQIIESNGQPMSRAELSAALAGHGIVLQGTDPDMVLSTMLWRMQDKIVRLPNHGYWPTNKAYPPAGYDPAKPYPGDQEHADMVHRDVRGDMPDVFD